MLDKYANTNVAVKISYDIACTLEAHLKVRLYCLTHGYKPGELTVFVTGFLLFIILGLEKCASTAFSWKLILNRGKKFIFYCHL